MLQMYLFPVDYRRIFEVPLALLALLVLSPLLVGIALGVRWYLGSPVLFVQKRPGLKGKAFSLLKFRSMRNLDPGEAMLQSDAQRLTPFGQFLRSTSLDELPSLWCIVKGDLALVGPRPLLMEYLPRYSATQMRRHEVRPGLTGWAQIHGRNAVDWTSRLQMDVWYVENRSLALDLQILWKTFALVISRQGVSAKGQATMGEFMGNDK